MKNEVLNADANKETEMSATAQIDRATAGKTAAIGAGLNILSAIPGLGIVFAIAGVIVELIGIKKLGAIAQEPKIFSHMLWGEILGLIGMVFVFLANMMGIGMGFLGGNGDMGMSIGIGLGISMVVMLIFGILSAIQIFKGLGKLATSYNVGILKTASWLYLIGMLTMPIVIGAFILIAYQICKIIGYISIK